MDRYEYLGTLKYYLRAIPEREGNQIIEELKSHFNEAELSGKTDEETAIELGDPKLVAAEILEEHEALEKQPKENKLSGFDFGTYMSDVVAKAINAVSKSTEIIDMKKQQGKTVRETDNGNNEYVISDEITTVVIKSSMTDFKVKKSDNQETYIETNNNYLSYELVDGALRITDNKAGKLFVNLKNISADETVVYLPEKQYELVDISTNVGDFTIDEIKAEEVKLSNTVGDLEVSKIEANKVKVTVKTGDTTIKKVDTKELEVTVATGDLDVIGINPSANIKLSVSVGDVTIKYTSVPTDITVQLSNTMGSIQTNGLFNHQDTIGNGEAQVTGNVSMGHLKFKLL